MSTGDIKKLGMKMACGSPSTGKTKHILGQDGACTWTETIMGNYETQCGGSHAFIDGSPGENGYVYCPYCGGSIKTT